MNWLYKWIEALRSGRYKQRPGSLFYKDRYCCLGVLCAVNNVTLEECADDDLFAQSKSDFVNGEAYVYLRNLLNPLTVHQLVKMNDSGKSFTEIADWIEANVKLQEEQVNA